MGACFSNKISRDKNTIPGKRDSGFEIMYLYLNICVPFIGRMYAYFKKLQNIDYFPFFFFFICTFFLVLADLSPETETIISCSMFTNTLHNLAVPPAGTIYSFLGKIVVGYRSSAASENHT